MLGDCWEARGDRSRPLIVHRLTNDDDRQAVERACGDLDRNAAPFIPTLAPGEAIIIGPDLPGTDGCNIHKQNSLFSNPDLKNGIMMSSKSCFVS